MFNVEQLQAELAALRAENEKLKEKKKRRARCKTDKSGNVTFLSSEGFQLTLSVAKWRRLLGEESSIILSYIDSGVTVTDSDDASDDQSEVA